MACIVAVLIGTVEFGVFMQLPLWILPLLYIFWITPNYFLEIVEHRALGNPGWPVFSQETLVAGRNQAGMVFSLVVLGVAGAYFALRYLEMESLASILLVAGLVVLPGSVALLAVTREFSAALNPLRVMAAAAGMGQAYLFCLLGVVAVWAMGVFAEARRALYWYPVLVYALFLLAWLIGSIVYTRRTSLGVSTPRSPEARAERAQAETIAIRNSILSFAYGFATRGNKAGALKHIEKYIATDEDTAETRLWMFNEMTRWEDNTVTLDFGSRVIEYCEQHGLVDEAARVRLQCEHLSERMQDLQ